MRKLISNHAGVVLVVVMFAAQILLAPATATAAWDDRSDELPGTDGSNTLIIVGAVAAGLLVGYLVLKGSKGDDAEEQGKDEEEAEEKAEEEEHSTVFSPTYPTNSSNSAGLANENSLNLPVNGPTLGMYFDITDDSRLYGMRETPADFSNLTARVGISIGF